MVRAKSASTVATTIGALPAAIWYSAAKRLRSHSREETALGRNCHSLASSVTGVSLVRLCRSPASWRASRSSAQRNTMGRPAPAATAAPTQARCTGWVPVRTAGHPPFSTRLMSSATSGRVCKAFRNASIRHTSRQKSKYTNGRTIPLVETVSLFRGHSVYAMHSDRISIRRSRNPK